MKKIISAVLAVLLTFVFAFLLGKADTNWVADTGVSQIWAYIYYGIFATGLNFCWWAIVNQD